MRRFQAPFAALLRERALCGSLLLACAFLVVANAFGLHLWRCMFLEVTGRPCPGCGLTRGMNALCRGDLHTSVRWHPFTPAFALAGLVMTAVLLLPPTRREQVIGLVEAVERRTAITLWVVFGTLAFGIWRIVTGHAVGEW